MISELEFEEALLKGQAYKKNTTMELKSKKAIPM
jgi:hypothetical protein